MHNSKQWPVLILRQRERVKKKNRKPNLQVLVQKATHHISGLRENVITMI